jgi:putative membrane protein insertion efficiency factor
VNIVRLPFLAMLRLYKIVVSPLLPPSCRFAPSCSDYAFEAIAKHGVMRGIALAAYRLLRCNPWNPGGLDPVPEPTRK